MSENKGAFYEEAKLITDEYFKEKSELLQKMIDNPGKYPELEAMSVAELLFGDYQAAVDKYFKE